MLAMAIAGCGDFRSAKALNVLVLESQTGKPVADAYVIIRWMGHFRTLMGPAEGNGCFHLEWAQTNRDGIAKIPGWSADVGLAGVPFWKKILLPEVVQIPAKPLEVEVVRLGYLVARANESEQDFTVTLVANDGDANTKAREIGSLWFGCRLDDRDARELLAAWREAEAYVRSLEPSLERERHLENLRVEIRRLVQKLAID